MSHNKITVNQKRNSKQRYEKNTDYISDEFKKLNDSLDDDGFSSDYARSIYKRYVDFGKTASNDIIGEHRTDNSGSVDTTAIADAKRFEMDLKDKAYEKIADYTLKKADAGLKILEKFSEVNQKDFDNIQTDKLNEIKIAKDKSEITGEIPETIREDNPYINPETGNVYDVEMDYQEKINQVKKELKDNDDTAERDRLIKTYNNLIDARYAKITKNQEYMPYISTGDIVSEYKTSDNKKDLRENQTEITKTAIENETEKYVSDNSLSSDIYTADRKEETDKYLSDNSLEGEKYKADKQTEADKYESLNKLKEKALDGIARHEELQEKIDERKSKEKQKEIERAEEKEKKNNNQNRKFGYPVDPTSYTVSSGFGKRNTGIAGASTDHKAIDLACDYGEKVLSSDDGVVVFAGWLDGYGNTVEIQHEGGFVTKYHHMAELPDVKRGDSVKKGQTIGKVGSTGISSGNHLDFQIFENGVPVDPSKYIPFV